MIALPFIKMGTSTYIKDIRKKIGSDLLLVPGVAAIIRDDQGRILVQQNKDGQWNLPAGGIDPGEKPAQAIVREIFEETGLTARPRQIVAVLGGAPAYRLKYPSGDTIESTTIVFVCDIVSGEIEPQDDETAKLRYFYPDEMPELISNIPDIVLSDHEMSGYFEWDESWLSIEQK